MPFAKGHTLSKVTGHTSINNTYCRSPEYQSYRAMKERCYYKKHKWYHRYGGRGITVCPRWLEKRTGFKNFLEDMGKRPSLEHSLDRWPNRDGNYEKDNCRWADKSQQYANIDRPFGRKANGNEHRLRNAA